MKKDSPKPVLAPGGGEESAESGVQLTREALYEQRMQEIYEDVEAGRCNFDEATSRVVEALIARTSDWFSPQGREELAALVRERCAADPRLRKALEG